MPSRLIKTEEDIKAILEAVRIIDVVYDKLTKDYIKEGMTELDLALLVYKFVIEEGGDGLSFNTISAFGENGCEPHHVPSKDKCLEKGMLVTLDMGAIKDGQCSDFTRTFAFGSVNEEQKKIYDIVKKSKDTAVKALAEDVSCKGIDKIARDIITAEGYGDYYIHGTGHGVGCEIHEAPTLNTKSEEYLKNGEVVTVEPGIYLPKKMGVRIEDMYIIGKQGALSKIPTELIVL